MKDYIYISGVRFQSLFLFILSLTRQTKSVTNTRIRVAALSVSTNIITHSIVSHVGVERRGGTA